MKGSVYSSVLSPWNSERCSLLRKCSCSKVSTLLWTIICAITAVVKVIWLPGTTDLMLRTVIWLPPSACALSLCRGISGTSLHSWSEGEGTPKASCWVRDVTCGTELHAVWPRSGHGSRSGEAQHDRNPTIQICQRWQDSAGKLCAPVSRGSGVGDWFVEFHSSLASLLLWCCYFTVIAWFQASGRDCGTFLSPVEKRRSPSSSQSITTHFYDKTLSLQTFCHLYNISFLLLKYVRVFLMEYILKCLEKRFTFLNICKILTCFVFLFVFLFYFIVDKKKSFNHFASSFLCNWGKKDKWRKKSYVLAYQEVLDGRSYIFNLSSGGDPTCERLPIQCL